MYVVETCKRKEDVGGKRVFKYVKDVDCFSIG